jgi:hypothetical protein
MAYRLDMSVSSDSPPSPWLFLRATHQRGRVPTDRLPYDDELQVSVMGDNGSTVPAVKHRSPPQTKKADIEKGEDQKDRW